MGAGPAHPRVLDGRSSGVHPRRCGGGAAREGRKEARARGWGHPRGGGGPNRSLHLTRSTPFLVYLPNDREQ